MESPIENGSRSSIGNREVMTVRKLESTVRRDGDASHLTLGESHAFSVVFRLSGKGGV